MKKFIIAIDLGATNIKFGLLSQDFRIASTTVLSTKVYGSKPKLIDAIIDTVRSILKKNNIGKRRLLGIGIGVPGPVDFKKGIVHYLPNIPGWREVGICKIIKSRTGINCFVDNDANLMALAECRLGAAKDGRNVVCLTLGSGIGGGIIIEGELYRGSGSLAGEIGHIPVNMKGPICNCGGIACAERYIGNTHILKMANAIFGKDISLEEASLLASSGNKKAVKLWRQVGNYLGVALAGVINLLNPDTIVIGGGVSEAGDILFDSVRAVVNKRAMPVVKDFVKIKKALLGTKAGIVGAGLLVKESLK